MLAKKKLQREFHFVWYARTISSINYQNANSVTAQYQCSRRYHLKRAQQGSGNMALAHSPGIITNGLVFAYDMSNTKKSWKGRPVTNQFAIPTPDADGYVGFQVNGTGTFRRIFSGAYGGYDIGPNDIVYRYDLGATGCHYHGNDVTINAGQTATWSFDYYVDPSVTGYPSTNYLANFEGVIGGSAGDPTPTQIGVWKRITFTGTAGSTGTCRMLLYPGACGDRLATGGFVLFKNPQVEFDAPGNNPSPFVAGTRSNTQAIVDLVGQNTVTASSLTYNSNGTFGFNGSSNYFDTGKDLSWNNLDKASLTFILKPSNLTMGNSGFAGKMNPDWEWAFYQSGTDLSMVYWNTGGGHSNGMDWTATNFFTSTSQYVVFQYVWDGSTSYVYRNGELFLTKTATDPSINQNRSNNIVIGGHTYVWGDSYWNGTIQVACFYNRALTPAEVKQNFNALRGRYGI